jgi:hypothetical protein
MIDEKEMMDDDERRAYASFRYDKHPKKEKKNILICE